MTTTREPGKRLYQQKGNCQGCHGWAGDGPTSRHRTTCWQSGREAFRLPAAPSRRRSVMRRSLLQLSFLMLAIAVSLRGQQTAGIGVRLIVVKTEAEAAGLQSRLQA